MRFLAVLLVLCCSSCSKAKTDLEAAFLAQSPESGKPADVRSVSITGLKKGDFTTFGEGSKVLLTGDAIRVDLPGRDALLIPSSQVHGCTMVCFGGEKWNVDLLIPSAEASLSFEHSKDVYEWCWSNKLPMISGAATRDWLYSGKPLPSKRDLSESLASRTDYDARARSACSGY